MRGGSGIGSLAVAAAYELEVFYDDGELAALGAALFVIPGVVTQAALDEEGFALLAILADDFGLFAEGGAVHEADFLALFAIGGAILAVDREAELGNDGLAWQLAQLRIARDVAHEQHLIEARHDASETLKG